MPACLADHAGMPTATVRPCAILEIRDADGADALLAEYEAESAINGMPRVNPQWAMYEMLEQAGALHAMAAESGGQMVGFAVMLVTLNPHYGALVGALESLFVASAHRHTGAGLALIREAERMASRLGAVCLLASSPHGGRLSGVLGGMGYERSNEVFCKVLPCS